MILSERILNLVVFILCGLLLIGFGPPKSIASDSKSTGFANLKQNQEPSKRSNTGSAARQTKLHHIRVGVHTGFTRLVFDSEGKRPSGIGPPSSEGIAVLYEKLDLLCDPERFSRPYPGAVAKVSHGEEAKVTKIFITFRQPNTRVETFFLPGDSAQKGFYRLVMDFYPPPSHRVNESVPSRLQVDFANSPAEIVKISQPASEVPLRAGLKGSIQKTQQFGEIIQPGIKSKPAELYAQLEGTLPQEEKADEAAGLPLQVIPLEVPSEPARDSTRFGISPGGYTSRYFQMERPRLGLGLSYEFDEERRKGPDIDTKDTSHEFTQRLAIETKGWAYHPALLKYTLRIEPEFSQSIKEQDPGNDNSDNAFLPGYFADATILEPKPYTFYLFGNRRETTVRSAFAQSSDTTIDTYGASLRLKYRVLPTTLGYAHVDLDQTGFFNRHEDRDEFRVTARNLTQRSNTGLNAIYTDSTQESGGVSTNIKTSNSTLNNTFDITGNNNIMLNSVLTYRSSDSDFSDSSGLRLNEVLNWRHAKNLRTQYAFGYENIDSGDFSSDTTSFGALLQHLLYENLTTTVRGDATFNDFSGGKENSYETALDFLYQRKIPWGILSLNSGWDYTITTREGGETLIQVIDELHVLSTGVVTLLDNTNVELNSIVVTDITGTIIFIENVDYTITEINSSVRIERSTFGAIANGQTVLVDYRFRSDPAFDDAVFGQTYGIQFYLWNALTLSYNFQKASQDILSGPTPANTVDDTSHGAEMQFDLGWTNTILSLVDTDRSSGVSTRRWLAQETLRFRPWRSLFFSLKGFYQKTEFKDSNDTEDFYGLRSIIDWTPARWCRFGFEGFREKVSGDTEETLDTGINASLRLSYRIWSGHILYGFLEEKDEVSGQKRTEHSVLFEIIRVLW